MKKGKRKNGLAMSVPAGLLCSGILSLVLTAGVSMALGKLVELQLLAENQIGYAVMIMLVAISFVASEFAWHKIKRRCVLVCLITGVVYWGLLLAMTALFFGGQYGAVLETLFMIGIGSALAVLCAFQYSRYQEIRKRRAR